VKLGLGLKTPKIVTIRHRISHVYFSDLSLREPPLLTVHHSSFIEKLTDVLCLCKSSVDLGRDKVNLIKLIHDAAEQCRHIYSDGLAHFTNV